MRNVIINSTPMIILSKIGMIDILQIMYNSVIIPQAVYEEITSKDDSACQIIKSKKWISVRSISAVEDKKLYRPKLHAGEVEVMILAQEIGDDVLAIIDDYAARKTAKYLGLTVTGTVGVLIKAKRLGYIESLKNCITLMRRFGFYISSDLENAALKKAGEV